MKPTYAYFRMKYADYYGKRFQVSRYHDWIATDADGDIFSYRSKPRMNDDEEMRMWESADDGETHYIGEADMQNTDWRDSLVYVGDGDEPDDE